MSTFVLDGMSAFPMVLSLLIFLCFPSCFSLLDGMWFCFSLFPLVFCSFCWMMCPPSRDFISFLVPIVFLYVCLFWILCPPSQGFISLYLLLFSYIYACVGWYVYPPEVLFSLFPNYFLICFFPPICLLIYFFLFSLCGGRFDFVFFLIMYC